MKVLFLDIDGVLNCSFTFARRHARWLESGNPVKEGEFAFPLGHLDEELIANLNTIVEQTNCKIVISSSWRIAHTPQEIAGWLNEKGFKYPESIIDRTGRAPMEERDNERGWEVQKWVEDNDVDQYCIVDDDSQDIRPMHPDNFVQTSGKVGLTEEKASAIVSKLNE